MYILNLWIFLNNIHLFILFYFHLPLVIGVVMARVHKHQFASSFSCTACLELYTIVWSNHTHQLQSSTEVTFFSLWRYGIYIHLTARQPQIVCETRDHRQESFQIQTGEWSKLVPLAFDGSKYLTWSFIFARQILYATEFFIWVPGYSFY